MALETADLVGEHVVLKPMRSDHVGALAAVGLDESIWQFTADKVVDREGMARFVSDAIKDYESGRSVPFVTCLSDTGKVVGSTRFGNIDAANRKVEIGWTWINPRWQRSFVNTEAKLLMLGHAFDVWNCIRVEFKTDALNAASRAAILRLGALEEGILRQHMITHDGRFRDSVYFSILDNEWPEVRAGLIEKLTKKK